MAAVTICSDFGAQKNKVSHCFHRFPIYLPWTDGTGCHDLSFLNVELKPTFSLSSFTFLKRLFSSSSFSAIRVMSSAYLIYINMRLLIFLLAILICLLAKLLQSCPTLCDPIDGSPPGSPVPGILQARTLERVAISFSNVWKWKVKVKSLSPIWFLVTPWTAAYQVPPPMEFSRQEYWSGMPLP